MALYEETIEDKIARQRKALLTEQVGGLEIGTREEALARDEAVLRRTTVEGGGRLELLENQRRLMQEQQEIAVGLMPETTVRTATAEEMGLPDSGVGSSGWAAENLNIGETVVGRPMTPQKAQPMGVVEREAQLEARARREKELLGKRMDWYAKRGLSGVTMAGIDEDTGMPLGKPIKSVAGKLAALKVFSDLPQEERLAAMRGGIDFKSVEKVTQSLAGDGIPLTPSDISNFMAATEKRGRSISGASRDIDELRKTVEKQVSEGNRKAKVAVQDIQSRPDFSDMTPEQYDDAVEDSLRDLSPIEQTQARLSAEQSKPEEIQKKEQEADAIRLAEEVAKAKTRGSIDAQAEGAAIIEMATNTRAFAKNDAAFRTYLAEEAPERYIPDDLTYESLREDSDLWQHYTDALKAGKLPVDETGKAFVAKAPPKSETPVTLKDTTFSGEERAVAASANSFVKKVMDETASGVPTYEPPEGVTEIIDKSAPTRIASIAEEHMGKGLDAAIRAGAAQVYESYPEELKPESGVEGMLGFYGNDAVKLVQKEAQEQANAALKTQRLSADEYIQGALEHSWQVTNIAVDSGREVFTEASDRRAQSGEKGVEFSPDVINEIIREKAEMRVMENLVGAGHDISPSKEVKQKAIGDASAAMHADFRRFYAEEQEEASITRAEETRREELIAASPDFALRWDKPASDGRTEHVAFDKADPTEQRFLKAYDSANSEKARAGIIAEVVAHKQFKVTSSNRKTTMLAMLDEGIGWERALYREGDSVYTDIPIMGMEVDITDPNDDAIDKAVILKNMMDVANSPRNGMTRQDSAVVKKRLHLMIAENDQLVETERQIERKAAQAWVDTYAQKAKHIPLTTTATHTVSEANEFILHNLSDIRATRVAQSLAKRGQLSDAVVKAIGSAKGDEYDALRKLILKQDLGGE